MLENRGPIKRILYVNIWRGLAVSLIKECMYIGRGISRDAKLYVIHEVGPLFLIYELLAKKKKMHENKHDKNEDAGLLIAEKRSANYVRESLNMLNL